jgi:hypothetical protein
VILRLIPITLLLFLIYKPVVSQAQQLDTLPTSNEAQDSIVSDTSNQKANGIDSFRISDDALTVPITFQARDSMVYSAADKRLWMYGQDSVVTEDATLTAGIIEFNLDKSEALARPSKDSSGNYVDFPRIREGENNVDATGLRYNFESGKARVTGARTKEGDLYIVGTRSKYVTVDGEEGDTTSKKIIYNDNAILTTCDATHPHFGIRSGRQKIITNEWAVMGPSYFEIGGIPTPLVLPFAAVPLKQGRRTGLIFPNNYINSQEWGFGLQNVGWYFPINDYWDARVTADIYLRGSYAIRTQTRYSKRYKFDGSINLDYSSFKQERVVEEEVFDLRDRSFKFVWTHNQDSKAHPLRSFSANVDMQTNDFTGLNFNTFDAVTQNSFGSRINYRQKFANRNWLLTASLDHSQNVATREFEVEFPRLTFTTNTFKPFKRKEAVGKEKWYEKITFNYSGRAVNRLETRDTAIFTPNILDSMQYGVSHSATADMNFRVFKYLNLTPSINYNEDWLFRTTRKELNPEPIITNIDTVYNKADSSQFTIEGDTTYSRINEFLVNEFRALRTFNASVNMNTQIFGTLRFKKGWLRGLRHIIKPNITLTYNPDYTGPGYNYFDSYQSDLRPDKAQEVRYSIFENNIFRRQPSTNSSLVLRYSINNIFEAKYYSKRDSSEKNFKLFRNITINGNYDFLRDSLKFSDISMNGYFPIFRNIINFRFSASFSPYTVNDNGRKIDKFQWDVNRNLLRFQNLNMNLSTRFTVKEIRTTIAELINGKSSSKEDKSTSQNKPKAQSQVRSIWSLIDDMRVTHNLNMEVRGRPERDTFMITTNQISVVGSIPLTEKWNIQLGNIGYDFQRERITYPDFGFSRDLHCWEMSLRWQPERNTYTFSIYVKPGSLDFMKIPYQRNRVDGAAAF